MRNGDLGTSLGARLMRGWLGMWLAAVPLMGAAACSTSDSTGDDDGGAGGGGSGGSGSGGGGGGGGGGMTVSGWTAMALPDDTAKPDHVVRHNGTDRVSGIYYASPDQGWIVSQSGGNEVRGGAVFHATGAAVTSVAFSGDGTGLRLEGSIEFTGLSPTPSGFIAMAYANDVIASTDHGATFAIQHNGDADAFGIERALAYQVTASGTTIVRDSGVVTTSANPPGPDAVYTDVWAPNATEPIPMTFSPGECEEGPFGSGQPTTRYSVYVGPDRRFIAYTTNKVQDVPKICISSDGGSSFFAHVLDVPDAAASYVPSGVVFTTATTGIAWFAQPTAGAYIKRTTDGGASWTDVALPAALAGKDFELPAGFFAPDGLHGWLAGFDHAGFGHALVLVTSDGGASWATVPGVADAVDAFHGGKLYSGFALDATHVWLGGEGGLVMHN